MTDAGSRPFAEWIGRKSESDDLITERLASSFRAVFEPNLALFSNDVAPLGIHWCLSPAIAAMAELGPDGHPAKNLNLPPVPQPRRMWAGGSIEMLDPLRIGDRVHRTSMIGDITRKQGRTGELWFVAVHHDYATERGLAVRERHDIVYREAAKPSAEAGSAAPGAESASSRSFGRSWNVETSPVLLFRYSAITFNGHRIHYDLPYATEIEGYRGLVVHGPIQATLLLNIAATDLGSPPVRFTYRGLSPAIAGDSLAVRAGTEGEAGAYWIEGRSGRVCMEAKAVAA